MGVFEALVLFAIGALMGVVATVLDVLAVGSASFVAHFSLWVLVNALFASHVGSKKSVALAGIPFNLGYIEAYYLTTAASYEGYAKSLVVPLALLALVGAVLDLALWYAKQERNAYGNFLTLLVCAGTLAASYLINGAITIFDGVVSLLVLVVLMFLPTSRFDVMRMPTQARSRRAERQAKEEAAWTVPSVDQGQASAPVAQATPDAGVGRREVARRDEQRTRKPTKRKMSLFGRRQKREPQPEASHMKPQERRTQRTRRQQTPADAREGSVASAPSVSPGISPLGTARTARRSSVSSRRRSSAQE